MGEAPANTFEPGRYYVCMQEDAWSSWRPGELVKICDPRSVEIIGSRKFVNVEWFSIFPPRIWREGGVPESMYDNFKVLSDEEVLIWQVSQ